MPATEDEEQLPRSLVNQAISIGDKDSLRDAPPDFLQHQHSPGEQPSGLSQVMFKVNRRAELFAGMQKILRLSRLWGLEG